MKEKDVKEVLKENGFPLGRMISLSKSGYRERNPDNEVYFNAHIITEKYGRIWSGDLDLTKDRPALQEIAKAIGENLYILKESDCVFVNKENEFLDNFDYFRDKAVATMEVK